MQSHCCYGKQFARFGFVFWLKMETRRLMIQLDPASGRSGANSFVRPQYSLSKRKASPTRAVVRRDSGEQLLELGAKSTWLESAAAKSSILAFGVLFAYHYGGCCSLVVSLSRHCGRRTIPAGLSRRLLKTKCRMRVGIKPPEWPLARRSLIRDARKFASHRQA